MSRKTKPQEAVILLIDVGQNVNQVDLDGQSFLQKGKQCASRIIQRKIFSDATDQFGLVLIGSEETENELNYPNIFVANNWLSSANWKILGDVEKLSPTSVEADWLDGLVVAVNLLHSESEGKKFTSMKIVMISNFTAPLRSAHHVDDVAESMKSLGISLVVIGPKSAEDEESEDEVESKGEILITRIVDEVEGVKCDFEEAMVQLDHFQKIVAKPAAWNCDLQIGSNIFVPISGFKKFGSKRLFTWRKRGVDKMPITQETVHFQGDDQVEKNDVIKAYLFGQSVVPISDDDKSSMALATEKCFQVVGFTKRETVPNHIFMGDSVHYIVPRSGIESASSAITTLVIALRELNMVAIVRKVYSRNNAPRLGALIPTCENNSYFFYFVGLPFAEDERLPRLPSLRRVPLSQSQLDAVDQLIDDMDLSQLEEDEETYTKLLNPSVDHINNLIVHKALNPNLPLPTEPSDAIKRMMEPNSELLTNAATTLNNIKNLFSLEEIEQKRYRRTAADVFNRNGIDNEVMEVDPPKPLGDSVAAFVQSTVTEVGTIDPEGNFRKLLEQGEPVDRVCEQMQTAIKNLIFASSTVAGNRKPLSALSLLREHCIRQNPSKYNIYIATIKDELVERESDQFWNLIVQDKLGLITRDETPEGGVNVEDAVVFYEIKKAEDPSNDNVEHEAEYLLDMI